MKKKELLLVVGLAILASFLSVAPTIWAYLKTPPDLWFVGFNFLHDPWDINVYLCAIHEGFKGRWLYQNPYDPTSAAKPLPIYVFYLFLGHLAQLLSLSMPMAYHLANFFLTISLFLVLYFFLTIYFSEKRWLLFTLILIAFGGGTSWLVSPEGIYLADISFPDGTFFQTLHLPHFILNQTLFLAALLFSFRAFQVKSWKQAFLGTLSGLFLAFVHPYSLLTVFLIFLFFILVLAFAGKKLTGVFILLPSFVIWTSALLFLYLSLRQTPYVISNIPPPPPAYFLLSYAFFIPFIILGVISFWRERQGKTLFLLSWFVVHFGVIYLPFSFHRLAIKGYFIILCVATTWGLKKLEFLIKKPWPDYLLLLLFSILTQVLATYLLISPDHFMTSSNRWLYLTKEEKEAFDFLSVNSKKEEIVLASYVIGNYLPAWTNNHVYFGHDASILDPSERREKISGFYSGEMVSSAAQFLKEEKINYVFWGPEEKALGGFDLSKESYLENVYQNNKVAVFKVK